MFCPHIKGKCRHDCIKWLEQLGKCSEELVTDVYIKSSKMTGGFEYLMQLQRISWRLEVKKLMDDPMVPNDIKDAIQEAKDIATLEKLLGNAGLLF